MSPHRIEHVEIPCDDPETAAAFYAALFGWTSQAAPEYAYASFETGTFPGGGFATINDGNVRRGEVLVYVETEDVTATLARAEALGAAVLVPRALIPGIGYYGIFRDTSGTRITLFAEDAQAG